MKKMLVLFFCITTAISCNQLVEEVEAPPYTVYPNPFVDVFSIFVSDIPTQSNSTISVTDGSGETIIEEQAILPNTQLSVSLQGKEKGVYFIEATINGKDFTTSILKTE